MFHAKGPLSTQPRPEPPAPPRTPSAERRTPSPEPRPERPAPNAEPRHNGYLVPATRIRPLNTRPLNPSGAYVLYWMVAARRLRSNFGLQRAVEHALALSKPLLILEALAVDYPFATARTHRFVIDGMRANAHSASEHDVTYFPYVEPRPRAGRGLVSALAAHACIVVTDDFPAFVAPRYTAAAAAQSAVLVEAVDSNGLIPLAAHGQEFTSARSYRAFVQRELRKHVREVPEEAPLRMLSGAPGSIDVPEDVVARWPAAKERLLEGEESEVRALPLDQAVQPAGFTGGAGAASRLLAAFVAKKLPRYAAEHNDPDADCTSRLSPYLHFGHIGAHEIFSAVMTHERWTTRRLGARGGGAREGWWGVSDSANVFLDQLVVWRELAFNGCAYSPNLEAYEAIPAWARDSLHAHAGDERRVYDFTTLDRAETHDEVWNAAQRQLVAEGWFHGYLRMLWGKKILEWSPDPPSALERMSALMNRYSLDGRDPVSYASYAWVLGRYDRPWPRRPVFGTVRAMSSDSAKRKLRMKNFLARYGR